MKTKMILLGAVLALTCASVARADNWACLDRDGNLGDAITDQDVAVANQGVNCWCVSPTDDSGWVLVPVDDPCMSNCAAQCAGLDDAAAAQSDDSSDGGDQ